jgi:hypothetical protein
MADGKIHTGAFFAKNDAYRKHPFINNNLRRSAPGLGVAVVIFSAYLYVEGMRSKLSSKSDH